jgi:hypothetical protein
MIKILSPTYKKIFGCSRNTITLQYPICSKLDELTFWIQKKDEDFYPRLKVLFDILIIEV